MIYNFDEVINRKNTNSVKWDMDNDPNILPMWVADMDFRTAQPIIDRLVARVQNGIYGYTAISDEYYEAISEWWDKRYNFKIKQEWLQFSVGVVPSISSVVKAFTEPGDKVLIQSPVYNYFNTAIINNKCEIVKNHLLFNGEKYEIDFDDFELKVADEKVKIFVLCNPHNPVGRAWTEEELARLGNICLKHNVLVLSDEIHRDLIYKGYRYIPFASINEDCLMNSITCTAPSKTFNLGGLQTSNLLIANDEYKNKVNAALNLHEAVQPNVFGVEALIAAYNNGEEWLDQMLCYLQGNRDYLVSFIAEKLPELKVVIPEATYLVWIDCRKLGVSSEELSERLLQNGKLRINSGQIYGEDGEGFIRMNIACSRQLLIDGLQRLEKVISVLRVK